MQAHPGSNHTPQRYSTNFIEWDDTPSFASSLPRLERERHAATFASSERVHALRRLLRDPATLADAMRSRTVADDHATCAFEGAVTGAHCRDTVPSALSPLMPSTSTPFCEPLSGVAVREVTDADVFRHFFGR